jgi:uncharacterized protein (UPF0332 family)
MRDLSRKWRERYLQRALQSLASARRLVDDGHADSAGSRVYFAVFNAVRATLEAVGVDPASSKTHQGTTRLFELDVIKAGYVDQSVATAFYQAAECVGIPTTLPSWSSRTTRCAAPATGRSCSSKPAVA